MPKIILTFEWDGTVTKETQGFVGKECASGTKFIEDALGITKNRKFKAEYYEDKEESREKEKEKN